MIEICACDDLHGLHLIIIKEMQPPMFKVNYIYSIYWKAEAAK